MRRGTQQEVSKEWLDLQALTRYACVSERTLREWIYRDKHPLPAVQVQKKILIRRTAFDQWLEAHQIRHTSSSELGSIVSDVLRDLRRAT